MMTRDDYVRLVENDYFGNVSRADIPAVVACFTDDATVTIYHGDAEPRIFKASLSGGETPLPRFFEHLLANYDPVFTEFEHYTDPAAERCAAHFLVTLTPKPGGSTEAAGVQRLRNCNFFRCRDGRIHDMIIYYSNPGTAAGADAHGARPTGFPQA
jgi:hypothetical protein